MQRPKKSNFSYWTKHVAFKVIKKTHKDITKKDIKMFLIEKIKKNYIYYPQKVYIVILITIYFVLMLPKLSYCESLEGIKVDIYQGCIQQKLIDIPYLTDLGNCTPDSNQYYFLLLLDNGLFGYKARDAATFSVGGVPIQSQKFPMEVGVYEISGSKISGFINGVEKFRLTKKGTSLVLEGNDFWISTMSFRYHWSIDLNFHLVYVNSFMWHEPYTIEVYPNPKEGGIVHGTGIYNQGEEVTIIGEASEGYNFINWTEDEKIISTEASLTFKATKNRKFIANYQLKKYNIKIWSNPAEAGKVQGGGEYNHFYSAFVQATPNKGYTFVNWTEGDQVVSTTASYYFTVMKDRNLTANFKKIQGLPGIMQLLLDE